MIYQGELTGSEWCQEVGHGDFQWEVWGKVMVILALALLGRVADEKLQL